MKCLSLGYLIVLIIVLSIWSAVQGSGTVSNIVGVLSTGAILYYVAGFFLPCDK